MFVDINGRLLVNFNDGSALGSERFVTKIVRQVERSFLLRLFSYGDADIVNYCEADDTPIPPAAAQKRPIGPVMQDYAEMYGVTHVIAFGCFHACQRTDSVWVNQYTTPCNLFAVDLDFATVRLLSPFISYDCVTDDYT